MGPFIHGVFSINTAVLHDPQSVESMDGEPQTWNVRDRT